MPLQFVFGPSGSGKSYYLYHHIIEESRKQPEQNYIVLVPEQFTMQTQKDLVSMHPNHGIMNIDVLSFGRLAYRVFEETGGGSLPVLDDEGKNLILRKIAGDYESELSVLRGNMKKLVYISEVKSVISEFTQYEIGEDELDLVMEHLGEDSRLYYKLKDIRVLYKGFREYLEQKYITKEELLDVLSREVAKSALLKNSTVVLDGFTGFTPVQNRLLYELLKHCRKVMVTVTMDERENPYIYNHPYQLFALSKQMVTSLAELAKNTRTEIEEPIELYGHPVYRFQKNPALAHLERQLFRYGKNTYKDCPEAVGVHVARSPEEEVRAVVEDIRRMVRTTGCRYREIGVIVSNMDVYGDYLERAFERYQIPFFMDHKRSILLNSFVEHLRSLLNMMEQQFSYESVFRFLRTNLSGFTGDEVDMLENYVLGLGIRGYKNWQKRWVRKLKTTTEAELETLNHLRVMFVEKIDALYFVLRQRKKTVQDITMAVHEYMVKEELQLAALRQEEEFQEAGELALAKEYAQVYRCVIELFDKFVSLLGEEPVTLKEYCELLDAGLEEARVGVIPPSTDQVVAGDLMRTRLKDIRALFFVGANDTELPGSLIRSGLLSERDREKFKKQELPLAPGGKEQAYVQKFYLYMNLTKPSERLEVYYSKVSADGKSVRPSYLIQELKRLYPKLQVVDEELRDLKDRELTEQVGIDEIIPGVREHQETWLNDEAWCELFKWYQSRPEWKSKIENLLEAGYRHSPSGHLNDLAARKLYGENFADSITRIEQYSACAYAHFLRYGLRLKAREEYEFEAVDLGNVCHGVLERYAEKVWASGRTWTDLEEEERRQLIGECMDETIADYGNSILYSTARNEHMITRIRSMMERTIWALTRQLAAGDFVPEAWEVRLGNNGKIDRVDICKDDRNLYVKVVDYKTGQKEFDVVALYYGLQLQLMFYMDGAVRQQKERYPEKEIIPAGVFYYRIQDPYIERKSGATEEEDQKSLLKALKPDGVINLKDEVLEHLDHRMSGESEVIPVKYNKNGSLAKASKTVPAEQFELMMDFATAKIQRAHEEILRGDIKAEPYRRGQETGCDYCQYRHICGFDTRIEGYGYRNIDKMSKEEAFSKMQAERNGVDEDGRELDNRTTESH